MGYWMSHIFRYQHELSMLTYGKGTAQGGGGLFHFCQYIGGVNWAQTFLTQSFKLIALRVYPLLFSASLWYQQVHLIRGNMEDGQRIYFDL